MLKDKWSKGIIDEGQSDADHFVGLFMLGDLIDQLVHKFLREELDLLGIKSQKEREVDVSKIDIELRLITLGSFKTNRHRFEISEDKSD